MQRLTSVLAIVALIVAFNFLPAQAQLAPVPAAGSIAGTVVDKDGKALGAGIEVKLFKHEKHAGGKKQNAGAAHQRPTPLATATTDANGHFSFTGLEAGDYMIGARDKGVGHGHCKIDVSDSGSGVGAAAATAVTITLEQGKAAGHGKNKNA